MGNYQESTITATPFTRARQIIIHHPYKGSPSVDYREERVIEIEGQVISRDMGTLSVPIRLDRMIPMRDIETGDLTGDNIPMAYAYAVIYSAYLQDALNRDYIAALPPEPDPVIVVPEVIQEILP